MEFKLFRFARLDKETKEVKFSADLSVAGKDQITIMSTTFPEGTSPEVKEQFLIDADKAVKVKLV